MLAHRPCIIIDFQSVFILPRHSPLLHFFQIGSSARPHPRKKAPPGFVGNFIGEDAYFSEHGRAWAVLGVADGVSGAGKPSRLPSVQVPVWF